MTNGAGGVYPGRIRRAVNFSGREHDDKGDFKTRVDESLAKLKNAKPAEPAKPAELPEAPK